MKKDGLYRRIEQNGMKEVEEQEGRENGINERGVK